VSPKNIYPPEVFWKFCSTAENFKAKLCMLTICVCWSLWQLQNFIHLSLNLTKVCHIKCNQLTRPVRCRSGWGPTVPTASQRKDNSLDFHVWGAMLQAFHKLHSKPKNIPELKSALRQIWDDLPQPTINKAINDFRKHLHACSSAGSGHLEQMNFMQISVKNFHGSLTTVVRAQNDTSKTANITYTIFDRT